MKIKRLFLTVLLSIAALFITCSMAFASNAVVDSGGYTHPPQFSNTIVIDGVDVSYWQHDIDWAKVKRQGIDYAYIRIGVSYLDSPFSMGKDSYFEQNYQAAKDAGIMVGVYYYSTAISMKEAQKEAAFTLDILNGRNLDLPVVYDYELDSSGRQHKAYYDWKSSERKSKATSVCLAYLNYIKQNSDYEPMFYSYRSITSPYLNPGGSKLNMSLIDNKYRVWLAQYSSDNSYERPYDTWQYTSSGSVTGISGSTDCNFWYYDNSAEKTISGTKSIKNASVSLGTTSYQYTKYKKQPAVTVKYNGSTLKNGQDYKLHYIKNVLAGTAYAWIEGIGDYSNVKLVPFTIKTADIADGGKAAEIADQTYNGSAKKPTVKVSFTGTTLKKNVDYTVSYSNNTKPGTATVTIKGKRNFHGSFTTTFKIKKATPKFTGYSTYYRTPSRADFTLNTKINSGGKLTYKSSDTSIATVDKNGTVSLKGGIGTAIITVTGAETEKYLPATKEIKIIVTPDDVPDEPDNPNQGIIDGVEGTTLKASSERGDGYIRIKWEKSYGYNVDYFEIFKSTKSGSYDSKPFYTTSDGTKRSLKNTSGLKNNTRYYYRVRGVREIDGKVYYTQWSNEANRIYKDPEPEIPVNPNQKLIDGVENTTIKASSERGDGYIRINWEKSAGYKVDYFEVFKSTKSNVYGDKPLYQTKDGTKYTLKNTSSLKKGTRYYYKIRGVREIDGEVYYTQWSNQANRIYR